MRFLRWVVFFGLVGCGGGDGGDDVADADADSDTDPDLPYEGGTEWVTDTLAIGDENTGFNLDQHETLDRSDPVGCGKPDGPGGVDNQLGPLLEAISSLVGEDFDANGLLAESIADGSVLLLVRALGLDTLPDDAALDAHFFLGADADADLTNNFLGDPPAEFLVDPISLENATDKGTPLIVFAGSHVENDLFIGGPADFDLAIPLQEDTILQITIAETQINWVFAADGTLADGILGGYVSIGEVLRAMRDVEIAGFDPAELEGLVSSVLAGQADIDVIPPGDTGADCKDIPDCGPGQLCTDGACIEQADTCDALSIGLVFSAVPASIVGIGTGGDSDTDTDTDSDSDSDTDTDTDTDSDTDTGT